jgi:hypothetical protein
MNTTQPAPTSGCKSSPALEAFCGICPDAQVVREQMRRLGFRLTFYLPSFRYPSQGKYDATISQPAQYHYGDDFGTEVIFLAGADMAEDRQSLPPHASRWWIYPGRAQTKVDAVKSTLTSCWLMQWQEAQA